MVLKVNVLYSGCNFMNKSLYHARSEKGLLRFVEAISTENLKMHFFNSKIPMWLGLLGVLKLGLL